MPGRIIRRTRPRRSVRPRPWPASTTSRNDDSGPVSGASCNPCRRCDDLAWCCCPSASRTSLVLAMALVFWIRSRIHEIGHASGPSASARCGSSHNSPSKPDSWRWSPPCVRWAPGHAVGIAAACLSRLLRDSGVAPLESLHVEALLPEQTLLILPAARMRGHRRGLAVSCAAVLSKSPEIHSFPLCVRSHQLCLTVCNWTMCRLRLRRGEDPCSFGCQRGFRIRERCMGDHRPVRRRQEHAAVAAGRPGRLPGSGPLRRGGHRHIGAGAKHRREHVSLVFQDHNLIDYPHPPKRTCGWSAPRPI